MVLAIIAAIPWILKIGAAIIAIMGTVGFAMFIYEEAIQAAGFGLYAAVQAKDWDAAHIALVKAKAILYTAKWFYSTFGWLSPITYGSFMAYANAATSQYEVYEKVISKQRGVVADPTAPGKVFNLEEAKANITQGIAPDPAILVAGEIVEEIKPAVPVEKVPVVPVVEVPVAIVPKISKADLFDEIKRFYVGRMYMSKKELTELLSRYDVSEIEDFVNELWSYYVGRMYISKRELVELGLKYDFYVADIM